MKYLVIGTDHIFNEEYVIYRGDSFNKAVHYMLNRDQDDPVMYKII